MKRSSGSCEGTGGNQGPQASQVGATYRWGNEVTYRLCSKSQGTPFQHTTQGREFARGGVLGWDRCLQPGWCQQGILRAKAAMGSACAEPIFSWSQDGGLQGPLSLCPWSALLGEHSISSPLEEPGPALGRRSLPRLSAGFLIGDMPALLRWDPSHPEGAALWAPAVHQPHCPCSHLSSFFHRSRAPHAWLTGPPVGRSEKC